MGRRTALVLTGVLALVGGYGVADAADVVPGVLTTDPPPADPQPYPTLALPGDGLVAAEVATLDAGAPVPTEEGLTALVEGLEGDTRMTGDVSMVVADAATGQVLMSQDGDTPRTTASSIKLLTAAAALHALGEDHVLATRVVQPEPGTLVLVGGGDVLLAAGEGDPTAVNGRAGLADLAAATAERLSAQGQTSVQLRLDDSLFTGPEYAEDWGGVDLNFVMPIQPIAVETGRSGPYYLPDPALSAANAFAAALREAGIEVAASVARGQAPPDAETVAEVTSAPLGQVVRLMLKTSDNSVAEVLARLVAIDGGLGADFSAAIAAVQQQLEELGIDLSAVQMADTSGLSAKDHVPASVLVDVLLTALSGQHPNLTPMASALPVGALDGTLADRMGSTAAAGMVRAKTGTLIETVSLSGLVVTADGRQLAFAVLLNGLEVGTALQARLAIDSWAADLAACGCR